MADGREGPTRVARQVCVASPQWTQMAVSVIGPVGWAPWLNEMPEYVCPVSPATYGSETKTVAQMAARAWRELSRGTV